jgi:hypothetical protein
VRRKRLRPVDEHLEWLSGRWPSEALRECERDFSQAPIAAFARLPHRALKRIGRKPLCKP